MDRKSQRDGSGESNLTFDATGARMAPVGEGRATSSAWTGMPRAGVAPGKCVRAEGNPSRTGGCLVLVTDKGEVGQGKPAHEAVRRKPGKRPLRKGPVDEERMLHRWAMLAGLCARGKPNHVPSQSIVPRRSD